VVYSLRANMDRVMRSYRTTTVELAEPPIGDTTLLAKLVPVLAQGAPPAAVAAVLSLDKQITEAAIKALLELGEIGQVLEPDPSGLVAAPLRAMRKQNLLRSGAYLLNAARRLSTGAGQSLTGVNPGSFRQAWDREQTYLDQHLQARTNRVEAAQAVTTQVRESGSMLVGWYSKLDEKTSVECRAAHGRNFRADQIPLIGLPGAVHPHCRCRPGPAHGNARLVGGTSPSPVPGQVMADASVGRQLALSVLDLGVKVTRSGGRHRKTEEEPSVFWGIVELTGGKPPFQWKHGWEPLTPDAVAIKAKHKSGHATDSPGRKVSHPELYHATREHNVAGLQKSGFHGKSRVETSGGSDYGGSVYGSGTYFHTDKSHADQYLAGMHAYEWGDEVQLKAHAKLDNPLHVRVIGSAHDADQRSFERTLREVGALKPGEGYSSGGTLDRGKKNLVSPSEVTRRLQELGYDGIEVKADKFSGETGGSQLVVFDAKKVGLGHKAKPQKVELADSHSYPSLERKPGKQNWVDKAGGLPDFIERIAKHLHYEKGYEIGRAIAVAVNTCRRWAAGGAVTEHGSSHGVSAETRAKAVAALASWEAKKARGKG
jgi:hypothetical protein